MPAFAVVGLVLFAVLCLAALGGRALAQPKPQQRPAPIAATTPPEFGAPVPVRPLSKQELAEKLKTLSRTEAPTTLSEGAMCYKPKVPADSADYVCPKCAARTQYSKNRATAGLIDRELPGIRKGLQALHGLNVSLDESQLCRKCTPNAPEWPQLALVLKHPDGTVIRTEGIGLEDVALLREPPGRQAHARGQPRPGVTPQGPPEAPGDPARSPGREVTRG
ncbi:MAG: hypothetical protein QM765_33910 [Myxococcales bacterium]